MNKNHFLVFIFSAFLFITFAKAKAQEVEATVTVNMEMVAQENKFYAATMEQDVAHYINNQKWTDVDWEGPKIPVDINIVLTGGSNGRFAGRFFLASKRYVDGNSDGASVLFKIADATWSFEYSQGASLSYNPLVFNNFSSLIDFYMLLAIGMDMDTYTELSGDPIFKKALSICNLGASANVEGYQSYSKPGAYSRYNFVNELLDPRYEPLRRLFFSYYVDGLDLMFSNAKTASKNLDDVIANISDFKQRKMVGPSLLLQSFFDAKAYEISQIFKNYENKDKVMKELLYLDPSNTVIYQDNMK